MTNNVVARRYASALFSLGRREGGDALEAHGRTLAELAEMLNAEPKLEQVLKSPVVSAGEKKAVLRSLLEAMGADDVMRNFCFLLADKKRLGALRDIAAWYGVLLDAERGVLRGTVVTAVKLSPEKQARLAADLKTKIGKDVELSFGIDPEILGGMVLSVGDRILDASLRAQLGILRENLRRGI